MSAISMPRARRQRSRWRSPISPDTISTLLAVGVLLWMPLQTLDLAGWAIDLNIVLPVTIFSVFLSLILARSRFGELSALFISLFYGIGAAVLIAAVQLDLPFRAGISAVLTRCYDWLVDLVSGGINTDPLVLTLLVALLFWFLAYNANWHIFRLDRVWRVILPPGLILLVNMIFFRGAERLDVYLFGFLLMALVLIVRSHIDRRQWDWSLRGIRMPAILRRQFALIGLLLSLLSLAFAWGLPSSDLQERLDAFQRFLSSDPLREIAEVLSRLFAPIEGEGPATSDYYGADLLNLSGAISLGDTLVFTVEAPPSARYYWRSRVYERYVDGQWSPSASIRFPDLSAPLEVQMNSEFIGGSRESVRQRFTVGGANSRIFYSAPQPHIIEAPGRIDLIYTDSPLNSSMNVSVIRPLQVLKRGDAYSVSSLISRASAAELRRTSVSYPEWVSGANLYVGAPNTRVLELTRDIVNRANAQNPYDRAKAIESWLRQNITYNESISAPPPNVDVVEWLLFEAREGYCTYYATAMIMMLRHLGIPARLAAGFSQGQYDEAAGHYVVREREAHTWVEVYFPGYGWIEFEPTSAQAPIHRDGDDLAQEQENPQNPAAPTASPTASPTPSPTPTPSSTPPLSPEARAQNLQPPSPTPTPNPLPPSPTPVILPTVQPPIAPDNPPPPLTAQQPLVIFAIVAALLLLILALIALLLFWWWEWRGMGGLSPVSRGYARLERYIQLIGISVGSAQTTLEKRRELQRRVPAAKESIQTISDLYTHERYGQRVEDDTAFAETADKAWNRTRSNILRRWLERWLPFLRD